MFCLLGLGYFRPHFSNKVSPKQTCLTFLPLFFQPSGIHVDVTLAYDDDRQIRAHKMEFPVNSLGIILEDSASLICRDETQEKKDETNFVLSSPVLT